MNEIEYEEFYLKYRQIAKSYAYGILEDWYLADDISQEVLYKMYTIRNDLDLENEKMLYALIRRAAVNKALDYKKKPAQNMNSPVTMMRLHRFWIGEFM